MQLNKAEVFQIEFRFMTLRKTKIWPVKMKPIPTPKKFRAILTSSFTTELEGF